MRKTPEPGVIAHIYIMQCGPYVKVGLAENTRRRLIHLQACNPYPVELVHSTALPAHLASYVESVTHARLHEHLHAGEWFTCSALTAAEAVTWAVTDMQKRFPPHWLNDPQKVKSSPTFKHEWSALTRQLRLGVAAPSMPFGLSQKQEA